MQCGIRSQHGCPPPLPEPGTLNFDSFRDRFFPGRLLGTPVDCGQNYTLVVYNLPLAHLPPSLPTYSSKCSVSMKMLSLILIYRYNNMLGLTVPADTDGVPHIIQHVAM